MHTVGDELDGNRQNQEAQVPPPVTITTLSFTLSIAYLPNTEMIEIKKLEDLMRNPSQNADAGFLVKVISPFVFYPVDS